MGRQRVQTITVFERSFTDKGRDHTLAVRQVGAFFEADIDGIDIGRAKGKHTALTVNGYYDEIECLMFPKHCVILTEDEVLEINAVLLPVT